MDKISGNIGQAHYRTELKSAKHVFISDEPESAGGKDLGFTPDELLAASLVACTCITLRMYADRKQWDLTDVKVDVTFERNAKEKNSKMIRSIELFGNLDETQKSRLLEIADNCPIHKTLTNPISIATELVK